MTVKKYVQNGFLPASFWNVLNEKVYYMPVGLENLWEKNGANDNVKMHPIATITRPLRERLFGILLNEIKETNPQVKEWCAENLKSFQRPKIVEPEYPEGVVFIDECGFVNILFRIPSNISR